MIKAMEEPAFVFHPDETFAFCNDAARNVLKILSYPPGKKTEPLVIFSGVLRFRGNDDGTSYITLAEQRYRMVTGAYDDGFLLRLLPSHESNHMLRLASSLDILPWGLMTIDRSDQNAITVFCNERVGDFLKIEPADVSGKRVADIFAESGISENMSPFIYSSAVCHCDHEAKRDGCVEWHRFHFIPYAPQSPYCLMVIENTTESKIMEGQYFQAQRLEALGQLAGGVAHDFNNILSIIDGYARIAKKSLRDMPDALGHLDRISQAVQRGSALTGQLLTFGRHKVMNETVFDLGELVKDQASLLRPLMDASIALTINSEDSVLVDVTADHVCQILMNICINARDAMQDGGELTIDVMCAGDGRALLRIEDTGCGMPPEVKAKIFDPFFTTKDQGKGTGLGLSMVYGLVKGMNGEIEVDSRQGKGTVFRIYLPLAEREKDVPVALDDDFVRLNGLTALIAEDEPDLLALVSGMMEEMGATVLRASNGTEALALQEAFNGDIDFLLTDVVMPELNGVKLAEMFGVLRPSSQVMFMSGYPANGQMARVTLPEGSVLMSKPVDFDTLSSVLKTMTRGGKRKMKTQWKMNSIQWKNV